MAKTAGSSVNAWMVAALGADACAFHVERFPPARRMELARTKAFVSGHVYAREALALAAARPGGYAFTAMRTPLEQVASHLRWLDGYATAARAAERAALGAPLRGLVDRIGATDLRDPEALDELMAHLPPWGLRMLDNMQARYLSAEDGAVPLTLRHARAAAERAAGFDRVLRAEALGAGLGAVARDLGLPPPPAAPRENAAAAGRAVDLSEPLVRLALSRRILIDRVAHAAIVGRGGAA
ncbi:hypothetical protein JQC91_04025 [Jannaschia sp. Os4]|uniref:hypothetical protein n=1 Tax=Jannaschia sp. Os4 TaxID=2807617 RepID=UPI001939FCFE|nr:hypothetical protein [Jannaschia sp. Os4]MBM2575462.1 hypothetical protein [Jannaschia sp. Os4]